MTSVSFKPRYLFDSFIVEPLSLASSQPHQLLISALSAYLVSAEAGVLAPSPFNWALGIGAEWAYLRGLSFKQEIETPWTSRLIASAVLLLILYGSLWSLRQFHAIPDDPGTLGAIVLTAIHILTISSVGFCSAMLHRVQSQVRELRTAELARQMDEANTARQIQDDEHRAALRRQREELQLGLDAKLMEARVREEIKALRRPTVLTDSASNGVTKVSHGVPVGDRDEIRAQIVALYKAHGDTLNVSHEAARLGISRGQWYKLRGEAINDGQLP